MTTSLNGLIKKVRRLVQDNLHGEAYVEAADYLGETDLSLAFSRINREHFRLGYLSLDLYHDRFKLYQSLLQKAAHVLSPNDYQRLYGVF